MIRNNHSSTYLMFKETPMSLPNSFNQAASNVQQPVETNGTDFSKIIPANDKRIAVVSADGTKVINGDEGFLEKLAYHVDGPLKVNSDEYVKSYKSLTNFGQPTTITYEDARSRVSSNVSYADPETKIARKVFPFFISKSCSDPRTMVFNIKDMCYITRHAGNLGKPPAMKVREILATIISDFKRFTSIENDMMNSTCRQKVKIANNYDEFPFSRIIASKGLRVFSAVRLFLSDSIIMKHNVEQIEKLLMELLRFVEVSGEGKQLSHFENFEVEVSITALSNGSQAYHFHAGKNYNMSTDQCNKLEFIVENTLRDIVCHGYSASNAHPFDLCHGVVMLPSIQNFKLVTTTEEEEENNLSCNIGQPPPYSQQ